MFFISIHIFIIFDQYCFYLLFLQFLDSPSCLDYHRPNPNESASDKQDMIFQNRKLFMIFQTFGMDKIDLHPIANFIFYIQLTLGWKY